jgi:hypothetical protein
MADSEPAPPVTELLPSRPIVQGPVTLAKLAKEAEKGSRALERMREIEADIFEESAGMMRDILRFADWPAGDPDKQEQLYMRWVNDPNIGPERADRMRNLCQAAWMGKKEAPIGLAIAQAVYVGGTKARALAESGTKVLNVQRIEFAAPKTEYPEIEVKE